MRERVHVNRTMKDLVADLRLMKSVLLSQYMPFLFAQRQEIGFPSRTEIDVPSPEIDVPSRHSCKYPWLIFVV